MSESPPHSQPPNTSPREAVNQPQLGSDESNNFDRLIKAMTTALQELGKQNAEQTDRYVAPLPLGIGNNSTSLRKAIEATSPKGVATDKKTEFWTAYKTMAEEYDKEFKEKYGTDLDTALIFAGLFSAVSSAFIIQIQPQVQVGNPPPIILVAQSLLYISLFATLMAALLAVLGKQWLMYYSVADRGSMEQRGIARQRKLDGIRKWKFEGIMQTFPLLLQFALLLFAAALSTYLWTVHHSLAIIVVVLSFLGFMAYMFLLISAAVSPDDCPFQTPLAPLLIQVGQLARTDTSTLHVLHIFREPISSLVFQAITLQVTLWSKQ
ncbi:hypothetical protein C8R44DRAFT_886001 [Mycena epipterygia]|nr:hypothetical protein C8R44DRAFT_886001 [Mycena epipterygia]